MMNIDRTTLPTVGAAIRGRVLSTMLVCVGLAGCTVPQHDYSAFFAHEPRSILVVPVLNETTELDASAVVATTLSRPLAERGYYVFPVYLTDALFKDLGLSEAGHVHELPPERFLELFGADAVLFVTVQDWSTKYLILQSATVVRLNYVLRDTRTGTVLWTQTQTVSRDSGTSSDPIGALISAAVYYVISETLYVDERPLAVQADRLAFDAPGTGLPLGPLHPQHGEDRDRYAP